MKTLTRQLKQYFGELYFLLLSLLIFFPLLGNGYILALDMIFTPHMNYSPFGAYGFYSQTFRDFVLKILSQGIPSFIIQKGILIGSFWLSGWSMYFVVRKLLKQSAIVALIAGTLYMWNPFTYSRLLAGQWAFLIGYSLTPFFFYTLWNYFTAKQFSNQTLLVVALVWFGTSLISIHHAFLFFIMMAVVAFVFMLTSKHWDRVVTRALLLWALVMLLLGVWIIPSLVFGSIPSFPESNLQYFASTPDLTFGLTFNLLSFYGFWAENTIGLQAKQLLPVWWMLSSILLVIASLPVVASVAGFISKKRAFFSDKLQTRLILFAVLCGTGALILAHGSFGKLQIIWEVLFIRTPLLQAFREVEKFSSLYLLAFVLLFALGTGYVIEHLKHTSRKLSPRFVSSIVSAILLSIILLYTLTLFAGAYGQLQLSDYPQSWYSLEHILEQDGQKRILVLPWLAYADFPFANRHIADPSASFFTAEVLHQEVPPQLLPPQACDIETYAQSETPALALCLHNSDSSQQWISQIKQNSVDYIVLNKINGSDQFGFLTDVEHFQKLFDDQYSTVYKVL